METCIQIFEKTLEIKDLAENDLKTLNYLVINVKDMCTIDVQPEYVYTTIVQ